MEGAALGLPADCGQTPGWLLERAKKPARTDVHAIGHACRDAVPSLDGGVAGVRTTIWHINADEPSVLDYNTEYKSAGQVISLYAADEYRSSDHDPVIVDVELGGRDADLCADGDASVSAAMMW